MDFSPKISIIIPVYNGSNYLKEAIESALNQTYENIEVIIVNDGSIDGGKTEKIAMSYGNKVRYFYKDNGGVASALNIGIKKMTGEYFSWLSHDDIYFPSKIEKQVGRLVKYSNNRCVLYSDFEVIDEGSNFIGNFRIDKKLARNPLLAILSTSINGCTTLVPKAIISSVGYFNERLKTTQDNEMWLRIYKNGFNLIHQEKILIKSRRHPEQGQTLMRKINVDETKQFYSWAFDLIYVDIVEFADQVLKYLAQHMVNLPFSKLRNNEKPGEKIPILKIIIYKCRLMKNTLSLSVVGLKNSFNNFILKNH